MTDAMAGLPTPAAAAAPPPEPYLEKAARAGELTQIAMAIDNCKVPGFTARYWAWLSMAAHNYSYLADARTSGGDSHTRHGKLLVASCLDALDKMYATQEENALVPIDTYLRHECDLYDVGRRLLLGVISLEPKCYDRMEEPRRSVLADLRAWLADAVAGIVYKDYGIYLHGHNDNWAEETTVDPRAERLGELWGALVTLAPA